MASAAHEHSDNRTWSADHTVRHVVGVMTGTSIDGIDAALSRITGHGLAMQVELVASISRPVGPLGAPLRSAAAQSRLSAGELAWYAHELGQLHATVVAELLQSDAGGHHPTPDIVCVHGQTVFHVPPVSWQVINVWPIVQQLGCAVVYDLRAADLAAGGQGAPITPMADWVLFRDSSQRRAIVNLGGYCNVTILPAGADAPWPSVRGFDVCACNQVLDAVAREALGMQYDDGGRVALAGTVSPEAAEALGTALREQSRQNRSMGTGDETIAWVTQHLRTLPAEDLAASAVWAVASCISEVLDRQPVDEILIAGGGAKHQLLVQLLHQRCRATVRSVSELGVPIETREALCMAVLGALCADGVPITLPQVTGCSDPAPVAGAWCGPGGALTVRQSASPRTAEPQQ